MTRAPIEFDKLVEAMEAAEAAQQAAAEAVEKLAAIAPAAPADRPPMVRMSVHVPQALYRQIKTDCAANGEKITDAVRELIETYWPKRKAHAA